MLTVYGPRIRIRYEHKRWIIGYEYIGGFRSGSTDYIYDVYFNKEVRRFYFFRLLPDVEKMYVVFSWGLDDFNQYFFPENITKIRKLLENHYKKKIDLKKIG